MKKILFGILGLLIVLVLVALPVLSIMIYNQVFGERFETPEWMKYSVSDFEGLRVEEVTFPSNKGQMLRGYNYSKEQEEDYKGVVVIVHGLGGGQNSYMDVADYFTSNNFLVFAYDATAHDESEGDSLGGIPQGVIDLDYALNYIKYEKQYAGLPVVLFGHSWGAYCAGAALNRHPNIKAAVLVAGFNESVKIFEQQGETMAGSGAKIATPFISLYERIKYGKYASETAMKGFEASDASVMIIHSRDDEVVFPKNGYDIFYEAYADVARFKFIEYQDRGHEHVYYSETSNEYWKKLKKEYNGYLEAEGIEPGEAVMNEYMKKHCDKSRCFELDEELMERILEVYRSSCKG